MKIHALQTGTVQIKDTQQQGPSSLPQVLFGGNWTPQLPIYTWLIEHPDGLIVVDTGETSQVNDNGYFPAWHPYFRFAVKMHVTRDDEIDKQLAKLGYSTDDVKTVILTHMHTDHQGGNHHFPNATFYLSKTENEISQGIAAHINGYLPQHRPSWFNPQLIEFTGSEIPFFTGSHQLAEKVYLLDTSGHSAGHISVLVQDEDVHYLLAGDISYNQDLMLLQTLDGLSDPESGRRTLKATLDYAQVHPMVYLPSHDPEAARRLSEKAIVQVD